MSAKQASLAGFYGKVPAFADFVHRRLPMSFIEPWSAWLDPSLTESRAEIGERWVEVYLSSPPWRFALDPGLVGPAGWLGVLASSVDEVRRCYPITVALSTPPDLALRDLTGDVEPLFKTLEATALALIDGSAAPDVATARLDELALSASLAGAATLSRGTRERLKIGAIYDSIAAMATDLGADLIAPAVASPALSVWWHGGFRDRPAASLIVAGLPAADLFASFLDGLWRNRGFSPDAGAFG
jgi:type VI secretion system protein ImpM